MNKGLPLEGMSPFHCAAIRTRSVGHLLPTDEEEHKAAGSNLNHQGTTPSLNDGITSAAKVDEVEAVWPFARGH